MPWLAVSLVALVFGFVGSMPLAGPIAVLVISRAIRRRFAEALRIGLGAAVAEGLYAGAAFWGFTRLLASHPAVVPVSRAATALVLVPLGARFMFWRPTEREDRRENRAGTALLGFTVSALNPTLFVTWSAAVAFIYSGHVERPSELYALPFGVCAAAGIAAWFIVLVALLRRYEGRLPKAFLAWAVRVLGMALVAIGVWSGVRLVRWFTQGG